MKRVCRSFSMSFGVVPDEMSAWNPDRAPQAIVTNRNGKSGPANTGPRPVLPNSVRAGTVISGRAMRIAPASITMTPIFMNVDR